MRFIIPNNPALSSLINTCVFDSVGDQLGIFAQRANFHFLRVPPEFLTAKLPSVRVVVI